MNKFIIVAKLLAMIVCFVCLLSDSLSAHYRADMESVNESNVPRFTTQDIKDRLNNISSVIDVNYTPEVGRRIREYTVNYRPAGEKILGRVDLFFPLFEREIHSRNLPEELKYVAVVESNLKPSATSSSGATGLWQFIKSTARMKGLKINEYVDERRDPEKSTAAALEYLSDLYSQFDDWTLAIAAYNCGPGNVRKAIRRSGGHKDFWKIRRFLPNETQKYVPRVIAAMYLMKYYHVHNLKPEHMSSELINTVRIEDGQGHSFQTLARNLEIPLKTIKDLNPMYKKLTFPKNDGRLSLVIPQSKYEKYLSVYNLEKYFQMMEEKKKEEESIRLKELAAMRREELMSLPPIDYLVYDKLLSIHQSYTNISL